MSSWLVFNEDDLGPAIEMLAALAEQSRWGVRLLPPGEEPGWEGWREPLAHVFAQPGTPRANGFEGLGVWAMFRPWRTVDLGLPIPPEWQLLRDEGSRLR